MPSNPYRAIVKCPFCSAFVDSRELADHARLNHVTNREEVARPHPGTVPAPGGVDGFGRHKQSPIPRKNRRSRVRSAGRKTKIFGLMPSDLEETRTPVIRAHIVKGETGDTETKVTWCPFCNAGVRPARLQKHLEKAHPDAAEIERKVKPASRKTLEPSWYIHCPVCETVINKTSLQEHLVDVHSMEIQLEKSGPRLVFPRIERAEDWIFSGKVLCPLCKVKLSREDMDQHFESTHPGIKPIRGQVNMSGTKS